MLEGVIVVICGACAVEREAPLPQLCPICDEERQFVPQTGQQWHRQDDLRDAGYRIALREFEPHLLGLTVEPELGIGQTSLLVSEPQGSLLWDPPGYVDDAAVRTVRDRGRVLAIAASHPHMFGAQVAWSEALGGVPVLVNELDREWIGRHSPAIKLWRHQAEITPELTLHEVGGHFPGSAVAHWTSGAAGRGVLLTSDTVFPNPDRRTVTFMRSLPNRLPMSNTVIERIAEHLDTFEADRLYGNVGNMIDRDGSGVIARSAARQIAWQRGDFDHLTGVPGTS